MEIRHFALGEHFLFDMQDRGINLVSDQRRHVFTRDADEVDVLGIDLGRPQDAAAENVGRAARVLMSARTTIEASNFGRLADSALTSAPLERPIIVGAPGVRPNSMLPASRAR